MLTTQQLSNVLQTTQQVVLDTSLELRNRNHDLEQALSNLVVSIETMITDSDGQWPKKDDGCIHCTSGVFNIAICPFHKALKVLGRL